MVKKRKKNKPQRLIIGFLIILVLSLIILLIIQFKLWGYFEEKQVVSMEVKDECSILMNNILHNIKDESSCENSCRAKCYTIGKEVYSSEFILKEDSCNECKCSCK